MPEPSLSELSQTPQDVAPAPVIDNSHIVDTLNQNARFNAENTWRKYSAFLENKKDLFKNIGDVQQLDTLPEDNGVLRKQAGDILSKIMKDPSIALGGKGFDEVNADIAKFRSDAMASKQFNLDYKANKLALDRLPELNSEENIAKLESEKRKPLNARKSVMFDLPAILDTKKNFEDLLSNKDLAIVQPYVDNTKTNAQGEPLIETGLQLDTKALEGAWNLAVTGGQRDKNNQAVLKAIEYNFSKLPADQQQKYTAEAQKIGGEITPTQLYWKDLGKQYREAYFAGGVPDANGIIRYAKTNTKDPYFMEQQKLAFDKEKFAEEMRLKWANYGLDKKKLDNVDKEDLFSADSTINDAVDAINNGERRTLVDANGKNQREILRISDPRLLQMFGNLDKEGNIVNHPDGINFDPKTERLSLLYFKDKTKTAGTLDAKGNPITSNERYTREIPLEKRVWLKLIAKSSNPNKDIGKAINIVEQVLKANGNSLMKIVEKSKNNQAPAPTQAGKVTSKGLPILK